MSLRVSFRNKSPSASIANIDHAIWRYEVSLDPANSAGMIGIGFSNQVSIKDPSEHADVSELAGTLLVKSSNLQFATRDVSAAIDGILTIAVLAPAAEDSFTPIMLATMASDSGTPQMQAFHTDANATDNVTQVTTGPSALVAVSVAPPNILPYASEPFGVYQPLIGWRSALHREQLSRAIAQRFGDAISIIGEAAVLSAEKPIASIETFTAVDRTGTQVGRQIAGHVSTLSRDSRTDWSTLLSKVETSALSSIARDVMTNLQQITPAQRTAGRASRSGAGRAAPGRAASPVDKESAAATLFHHLSQVSPNVVAQMFQPAMARWERIIASTTLFADEHPARSAFLSPIGILHLFREYFFELGTFLGPPVGHVWLSPGGTVELIEVNVKRTVVDLTVEQSTETVQKSDLSQTNQDELSDAVKTENANDTKLGVTATASGGVAGVFQASASSTFNLDSSRKQAQEQTHKQMREQSSKLSSEVRQNYKTTFRTVTETTDTSSRRYLLQNTTTRLVSYELSRKMRKVAVQVQDLGQRLCWQLYVDNPGDTLGLGEFVHATSSALDPGIKQPDLQPYPANIEKSVSLTIPFVLYQGADSNGDDTYETEAGNADHGIFSPDVGKDDIIQFKFDFKCPPAPPGFILSAIGALDFRGAQVKYSLDNLGTNPDPNNDSFSVRLTYANFAGKPFIPFDASLVYEPTADAKSQIDQANKAAKAAYDAQVALKKEQLFYDTLRARLKLVGQVHPRPSDDLREEERNVIYRAVIARLYGNETWTNDDFHIASELIRYFFDIDAMLYFVAPDWWRPRQQSLTSINNQGELQPTIIAEPAVSARVELIGKHHVIHRPGHRPYYLITEETTPAPQGASLGWLIQLDGDPHRNAFLNSPWVKAVLPIRPGRERDAMAWLERPEVAGTEGLDEAYPFDAAQDPPDYQGQTIRGVLLKIADKIAAEYQASLTPVPVDPADVNSTLALPTETVFNHGFDPLEGGIKFGSDAFKVFSQWIEVLPTDQVVATEYSLAGL